MIRFDCPQCGKRCKAPVEAAGRRAKCSRCGASVLVPSGVAVLATSPADPPRQDQFTTELVCQDCGQRFSVPQDQVGTGRPILCSHCGRPFTGHPHYVPPPEPPPLRQQPPADVFDFSSQETAGPSDSEALDSLSDDLEL